MDSSQNSIQNYHMKKDIKEQNNVQTLKEQQKYMLTD